MTDCRYWIWMQQLFGIATQRSHRMLESCENPEALYEAVCRKTVDLHPAEYTNSDACMERAREIEAQARHRRVDILTPEHPDYPALLHSIYAKPLVLYGKGDLSCLQEGLPIAMVGPRRASAYGERVARDLAGSLAEVGGIIISGLAVGIDSISHRAAMEHGGCTVGVMGCGLDIDYPQGSASMKTAMKTRGAVISEYPLGTRPTPRTFPPRNRIIAGMARGTVVVEAGVHSGALITAQHALDAGRDVFAVPGSIYEASHRGANRLLQEGAAKPICRAADILEEYPEYLKTLVDMHKEIASGWLGAREPSVEAGSASSRKPRTEPAAPMENRPERRELPADAEPRLAEVFRQISEAPKTAGVIASRMGADIGTVMASLTELEIMGFVVSHPGGFFSL